MATSTKKYRYPEYRKRWLKINKDKVDSYYKKWRDKNPDYQMTYYSKNKDKVDAHSKANRLKRKIKCFEYYCGSKPYCMCCGEKEIKFLGIDHINGGGSKQKKELGGGGDKIYRWLIKNNFPLGFQVLCHNCNQAKGAYGICPHQKNG